MSISFCRAGLAAVIALSAGAVLGHSEKPHDQKETRQPSERAAESPGSTSGKPTQAIPPNGARPPARASDAAARPGASGESHAAPAPPDVLFPGIAMAPNIHPVLVHGPVVLWPLAALFFLVAAVRDNRQLWNTAIWIFALGVLNGVAAGWAGLIAEDQLGHSSPNHELVHLHKRWMLSTIGASIGAGAMAIASVRWRKRALIWAVVVTTAGISIAGVLGADRGGMLVYGYAMGVRMPPASDTSPGDAAKTQPHGH